MNQSTKDLGKKVTYVHTVYCEGKVVERWGEYGILEAIGKECSAVQFPTFSDLKANAKLRRGHVAFNQKRVKRKGQKKNK